MRACALWCAALCTVLLLPDTTRAMDAVSADSLASAIVTQLGRAKGVCAVPNCGDGQLARALLQHSEMKVFAMDSDPASLQATQLLFESTGRAMPRCYVTKGDLSNIPFLDRFVDCIVVTNLTDADLAGVPYAEIERAVTGFIGDRMNIGHLALSREDLIVRLSQRGVDDETCSTVRRVLADCERARYSPTRPSSEQMEEARDLAAGLIVALDVAFTSTTRNGTER